LQEAPSLPIMLARSAIRILLPVGCWLALCIWCVAQSSPSESVTSGSQINLALPSSVYVKVRLDDKLKVSTLKPGDIIEGKLAQDIYSGDRELFSAGSRVRLTVDKLERRRRIPNDHWPWVVKAFTPRYERYPTFRSAGVISPEGKEVTMQVSLINVGREREIRARSKTNSPNTTQTDRAAEKRGAIVTLQAENPSETSPSSEKSSSENTSAGTVTLSAGTQAKIVLLGGVSASNSRPGDSFQARLVEPVRLDSQIVLPEGTLLGGKVVSRTPPRMLSRAGSLMLSFTELMLPGKSGIPASASVSAAELDERSHTKIDPEGKLHGDRPGKAWMAINVGVTGGIAKEADDGTQLVIEAIVSAATDASTAGSARIAGICASSLFLLTRHGRDVVLPKFTEMNVVFDRPLSLAAPTAPRVVR
jgi:hypothetical protein